MKDSADHLAAALKDLNQHSVVEKIFLDSKDATKPAEKLKVAAKNLAALLTVLQILALTALQTGGRLIFVLVLSWLTFIPCRARGIFHSLVGRRPSGRKRSRN